MSRLQPGMQEAEDHAYLDLVEALLSCPQGEEQNLLATKPDLINEQLVKTMLAVSQMLQQDEQAQSSNADWLNEFAINLAQQLGLGLNLDGNNSEKQLHFLMDVLQSVAETNGDFQIIYSLLCENLALLNDEMIAVLEDWAIEQFAEMEKEDRRKFIAMTIGEFGNLIQKLPLGNRAVNIELSISSYNLAGQVFVVDEDPQIWASIQNSLANAYSDRIRGDKAENLEISIACYQSALEIYTYERFPVQWAMARNNLANAYSERIRGDRAENLEISIAYYASALKIYTKEHFSREWAMVQNNIANAYLNRIKGDRAYNLEQAICCYDSALAIRTKSDFPIQWAITHNNLANAYSSRIQGDRSENLEKSISYYESALEIYTKSDFPIDWAVTQNNLANTYLNRIKGDRSENLEKSIIGYQLALEVRTKSHFPLEWATTQNNLANAYSERIRGGKADNLESAISCYESALEIYTKYNFPIEWAMAQNNLANVYSARIQGDRSENLEKSIIGYQLALDVRTSQSLPIDCLQSARNLGNAHFNQGNWQKAIDTYKIAMQAAETSRIWSVDETERQRVLETALNVYENSIQCAINLNDYRKAIEYTERIRSRQLVDLMGNKDLYPDAEIPAEIQQYLDEYEQLSRQIQHLREYDMPDSDGSIKATHNNAAIFTLEQLKRVQYLKIRSFDPAIAGQIAVEPIDFAAIQKLITTRHTAILTCYTTDNDTHIFIIKQGQEPTIHTCTSQSWSELQQWLQTEWVITYHTNNSIWQQNFPTLLSEISQRLQLDTLIEEHLTDITELIIVPHLNLHQIPFAALPINPTQNEASENPLLTSAEADATRTTTLSQQSRPDERGGTFLGDKFIIRSIPSCQILQYCQERKPITTKHIGTIEDADDNLLGARYEGEQIAAIYSIPTANRLRGKTQSTIANYRQLLSRVNLLHASHHGISRPDNPLESALLLSDGRITLGDLLLGERYPGLDEVFLSVCETHLGKFTFTDDVATLSTGFLCIGARSVISTLWSVDDLVTALFDIFYHQERYGGLNRAFSLQAAQIRLRNLTGEEFKISHYPQLIEHVTQHSLVMIATLKHRMKELYLQKSTLDDRSQEWQEIAQTMKNLTQQIRSIESLPGRLRSYCESDLPFESPFYWAGFICQGMA